MADTTTRPDPPPPRWLAVVQENDAGLAAARANALLRLIEAAGGRVEGVAICPAPEWSEEIDGRTYYSTWYSVWIAYEAEAEVTP